MSPRQSTRYLMWCSKKAEAGVDLTPAELEMMKEAQAVAEAMAQKFMRLEPEDYAYIPGKGYGEE